MNNDRILVENTLKGDADSFTLLTKKYQQSLYNLIFKMTLSREDSEEILQDVFLKAYKYLYKYDRTQSFSSWIFRIAVNTFKTYYKKNKKYRQLSTGKELPEELSDSCESPESVYENREIYNMVVRLINNLTEEQKTALVLRHMQGFSNKEVGEMMGISPQAVKMKVQRAKLNIWERLKSLKGGVI